MKKLAFLLIVLALLAAACGTSEPVATPSATGSPTMPPTEDLTPSATSLPPTLTATPKPVEGTIALQVHARSGPGASYESLGLLNAGETVQIVSRDSQSKWYQILYPSAPQGRAWVTAQYVQLAAGVDVPVEATPTSTGPTGRVTLRINVRSGPGMTFNSLGMLEPGTTVSLTGKNSTASWYQIDYPAGPDGHGWVTVQYIETDATAGLPVLDDFGRAVTPGAAGTPSGPEMTPTPTIGPAYADNDSAAAPAVRVTFSASGTRQFTFSGQVSAPDGDGEDWVEFTPFSSSGTSAWLVFSLTCAGNGALAVELWQGGTQLNDWGNLICGDLGKNMTLTAGQPYQVRLVPAAGEGLRLVNYVLSVQNKP